MTRIQSIRRATLAVLATAIVSLGAASTASAQNQTQNGLVNVAVEDVIVQVPVAVAANICDVNVAVLAEVADDAAACEATSTSTATAGPNPNGPPTRQEGLVNVLVDDVLVQLPIALAANVCDVNVAVLARLDDEAEACNATADAAAQPGSGGGGGAVVPLTGTESPLTDSTTDNSINVGDLIEGLNILG
jgi:hypothetical protein